MKAITPPDPASEVIDTRVALIERREDGIICVRTKNDMHVTLTDSIQNIDVIRSFSAGGKVPLLVIAGPGGTMEDEVEKHWLEKLADRPIFAEAIVTNSLAHNILVNFSIKFYSLDRPVKMFTNEKDAINWLKMMKDN